MRSTLLLVSVSALVFTASACKSREQQLQDAEDKGNLVAATKAKVVEGVGKALKNEGKDAAKTLTEGTGDVVKAVGQGFDNSLEQVKFTVDETLPNKGLNATRAALTSKEQTNHGVTVYVTVDKPYSGPLELRAFDAKNLEIGRSKVALEEKESTAKYVDFKFDERTPLLTADHFELR